MSDLPKLERRLNEALTNLPSLPDNNQDVRESVASSRNYELPIDSGGLFVQVDQIQGATNVYYTYNYPNPSEAMFDGSFSTHWGIREFSTPPPEKHNGITIALQLHYKEDNTLTNIYLKPLLKNIYVEITAVLEPHVMSFTR